MKQWKCPVCGMWLPDAFSVHWHHSFREPSLDEMIDMRRAAELNIPTPDPLSDVTVELTKYFRTGKEPTRETDE